MKSLFKCNMIVFGLVGLLLLSACTPKKIASDLTAQIFKGGSPSFERESDLEVAELSGLPLIKVIEAFQYDNPHNKTYKLLLARAYATYAFGFSEWHILQNASPEIYQKHHTRAKEFYRQGKFYALEVLKKKGSFAKALSKDLTTYKKAVQSFGKSDVPAMFWAAFNWGSLINLSKDSPAALAELPKVEILMRRVLELDENFYYGGPNLFFGVYYGSRPKMFGGDAGKSKQFFEKAIKAFERKFLLAQVTYAQTYAVQNQDRALFETLLNEVLSTNPNVMPEQRLGNELAHARAKWLLAHADQFFGGVSPSPAP